MVVPEDTTARIGIMQGRLVRPVGNRIQCFPVDTWIEEFPLAVQAGLDCIEWIYDEYGAATNPLGSDEGVQWVRYLCGDCGVSVVSLCADFLMDRPLLRADAAARDERLGRLLWLMRRAAMIGVSRMVLPFVDASQIEGDAEIRSVAGILEQVLPTAEATGIELHLETSLDPEDFVRLLDLLPHPMLRVNYDSGNSASLGYDVSAEFAAYGHRVGSVHIKDRVRGGGTVPLGAGDADLGTLFDCLRQVHYSGDYILQVARGAAGDELAWAVHNRAVVVGYLTTESN